MTLVWGFGPLADFTVSVALIFRLTIGLYLMVGSLVGYRSIEALAIWTYLYRVHRTRALNARRRTGSSDETELPQMIHGSV